MECVILRKYRPSLILLILSLVAATCWPCSSVIVGKNASANGYLMLGHTEDISPQGLFVQTIFVLPRGTALDLEIDLEDGTIARRGRVVWAKRSPAPLAKKKRCGMGIHLDEPCPELTAVADGG